MSIASRITSIENHIEEAYTEISRLGVDLTNVDKNIDNIADKLQEAYSQSPKVTDEGSSLSLTPTRKGGLSITPKGACEQDSYSGKNQLPYSKDSSHSGAGIEITQSNGIYNISGTSSGSGGLDFQLQKTYTIKSGDYLHCMNNVSNASFQITLKDVNNTNIGSAITLSSVNKIADISSYVGSEVKYVRFYHNNQYAGDMICSPMIVNNVSTATEWEQYVGGIPSPNPDYPQDIRVVTGDNSVNIFGKNLYEGTMELGSISGGDGTNGTNTNMVRTPDYIDLLNIRKIAIPNSNNSQQTIGLRFYNKDKQYLGSFSYTSLTVINLDTINVGNRTQYYTSNADIYYLRFVVTTSNDTTIKYAVMNNDTTYIAFQGIQSTTLHLGTNYLAGIGTYKDEIVGKTDNWKIVRKIRHLSLAVSAMDNLNNYPGWKNVPNIKDDIGDLQNIVLSSKTNYKVNIGDETKKIYTSTKTGVALYLDKTDWYNRTQTEWKTNYPNLTFDLWYGIVLRTPEETITDTTLITDLNNMYQAMGYDGTTNITITSNPSNAQMTASVSALKGE